MELVATVLVTATIFMWGLVSARLERADLSAPIVFTLVGALLATAGLVDTPTESTALKSLVEVTLVWVLFADAARIRVQDFRRGMGEYVRLLGVGLPLTVLAGWLLAVWLFPDMGWWLALLVAAALAPTDAALGLPVVTNPVVPSRIRRLITVESGLNDGIVTPVVMVAIAGVASAEGLAEAEGFGGALLELAVGAVIGVAVGLGGGWLLCRARRSHWAAEDFIGIAVLALALLSYVTAVTLHGNGFVAAFCGGLAFGAVAGRRGPAELVFLEQASGLVSLLVWTAFGAVAIPIMFDRVGLTMVLYAVLSLTFVRMVPVALASIGSALDRNTVLFVGWFGPRGLASLVFALIALEELGAAADDAVAIIGLTVFLSVLAHGLTAVPLVTRYGQAATARTAEPEEPPPDLPLPRSRRAAASDSTRARGDGSLQ